MAFHKSREGASQPRKRQTNGFFATKWQFCRLFPPLPPATRQQPAIHPARSAKSATENGRRLRVERKGSGMRAAGRYAPRCKSIGHSARQQSSHSSPCANTGSARGGAAAQSQQRGTAERPRTPAPDEKLPPHTPAPCGKSPPHACTPKAGAPLPAHKKVRPAHAGRTLTLSSDNRRRCVHRVTQAAPRWSREPPPPR